ncbi:MAG: glycoside hydrolase family 16 protein [Paraprevotella sp.]|nr:glycoside hydrolase family 16 protein [Paraprevotella sp.]
MKAFLIVLVTLLSSTSPIWSQEYQLVWSEEFDYEGAPDSSKWRFEKGFVRNHELQWYQEENAYCKDGLLVIEARNEQRENPLFREQRRRDWRRSRPLIECTSSSINTRGHFEFTYGRLEVRARIPVAKGAWPAIWTLGTNMEWPSCGEIDIMEFYRIKGQPVIMANVAWGKDKQWDAHWDSKATPMTHFLDKDPDWASDFHVWRMDWTEESIRLYLDDELLNETLLSETVNGAIGKGSNPFKQPHYILLNLAIGGDNGGPVSGASWPIRYEVDYVRVYQ